MQEAARERLLLGRWGTPKHTRRSILADGRQNALSPALSNGEGCIIAVLNFQCKRGELGACTRWTPHPANRSQRCGGIRLLAKQEQVWRRVLRRHAGCCVWTGFGQVNTHSGHSSSSSSSRLKQRASAPVAAPPVAQRAALVASRLVLLLGRCRGRARVRVRVVQRRQQVGGDIGHGDVLLQFAVQVLHLDRVGGWRAGRWGQGAGRGSMR